MTNARTYRAEAVVLRGADFAERDRLLTLYTRYEGKLRALAKGVRRTTSKLSPHVDLFSHAGLFLVHGRNLDQITQGQSLETFPLLHSDLWRLALAFYCAELVDRFVEERIPNPGVFEALIAVLRRLNDEAADPAVAVRAFELDLLGLTGYRPQLHRCVSCQSLIEPGANSFSAAEGGVLCPTCAPGVATAAPISVAALRILRNLQTRPEEILGRVRVAPESIEQAEGILIGYIQYLLETRIRSAGFIDILRRLRATQERSVALG